MGRLLQQAALQKRQRDHYVAAAERAVDKGRYGRARRLFRLAEYTHSDIVTFYDEGTAAAVYGEPEA